MQNVKETLLSVARAAIAEAVGVEYVLDLKTVLAENTWLEEQGAAFVTLSKENEELRGCIGSIVAHQKLYDDIIHNAKSAALNDPRFPALRKEEFESIVVEVSVLTAPQALQYDSIEELKSKITVGVDGVILKNGIYQATFLPQVWKQLPTFELFFEYLCQKAQMETDCLSRMPDVFTYQVKEYKED